MVSKQANTYCKLYAEWISQWIDETKNENIARTYSRALKSLNDSDMSFTHPSELKTLKFVGEKICLKLEKRLKEFCSTEDLEMPETPRRFRSIKTKSGDPVTVSFVSPSNAGNGTGTDEGTPVPKRQNKSAQYIPKYRSGAYALLITLRKYGSDSGMGRTDLTRLARAFSDNSFDSVTTANGYYTAWNSMKTLIKHELVYRSTSRTAAYMLTDRGTMIADKLLMVTDPTQPPLTFANSDSAPSSDPVVSDFREPQLTPSTSRVVERSIEPVEPIEPDNDLFRVARWPAGSFKVKLLLDNREVGGVDNRTYFADELRRYGVNLEITTLAIGDVQWIAEHKTNGRRAGLDFIMERKRLDDLVSSIRDGRLREQKTRLHRSTISTVYYLVEEPVGLRDLREEKAVRTVLSQTVTADKFHLIRTSGADDTVKFLTSTTDIIRKFYKNKSLAVVSPDLLRFEESMKSARSTIGSSDAIAIDFDSITSGLSKSRLLTIRDIFIRMLMTTRNVTYDKASIIQKLFPAPIFLHEAYESCYTEEEKKVMLSNATANYVSIKKISKKLSQTLYDIWGNPGI